MYLILAMDEDVHADAVLYYLKEREAEVRRFDISSLFEEYGSREYIERRELISIEIGSTEGKLIFPDGKIVSSKDIEGIYCRSFYYPPAKDESSTAEQLATFENKSALRGFFSLVPDSCIWINDPYLEEKIDNKIYQHQCALRFNLEVPDSLVTNSSDSVRNFFNNHNGKIIIKQMSDVSIIDKISVVTEDGFDDYEFKGFYTSLIRQSDLDDIDDYLGKGCAPVLIQEALDKRSEIRVTVVGDKCFSYRIYSQERVESKTDFRRVDDLRTEKCELQENVKNKIIALVKYWNIYFAAIDFVETTDNRIVFLEANVVGNWLWLEQNEPDSEIAQAITTLLLSSK